jgi:thiol-disulfide isomerase/thioredoxin
MRNAFFITGLTAVLAVLAARCLTTGGAYTQVAPGIWRGVLELEKFSMPVRDKDTVVVLHDPFKEGELPFNFEVKYLDDDHFYVEFINGSERIRCDSVRFGRDRTTARDTVNIYFPEYQSYLHADIRGGIMQGEWVVTTKDNYRIPFHARAGQDFRFTPLKEPPAADLSGEWAVLFGINEPAPEKALGEFKQQENRLEGTFRTETGDYRFLEGTVQGRKFWLSAFDGSHAYLFSGSIRGDSLQGEFRSGTHYRSLWTAWRDPSFRLGDPDTLTTLKENAPAIAFTATTPEGKTLTYPGPAFDGKVKIFTVMGTWCPNCRDEQIFLREYLETHSDAAADLAIVGFAFERFRDTARAQAQLSAYRRTMKLPFDLVFAGKADKAEAERLFPALSHVMAFPTMIVVDKNNRVRKIHTGFEGPATSRYAAFKNDFAALIETLRNE